MKHTFYSRYAVVVASALVMLFSSCIGDNDETIVIPNTYDWKFDLATTTEMPNPNMTFPSSDEGQIDMLGIKDQGSSGSAYLKLQADGEARNFWVFIDGESVDAEVVENETVTRSIDVVFLVDNSGTMSDEADKIASDIKSWSAGLQSAGLDVKFGLVGYDYGDINGAIDMTGSSELSSFLNGNGTGIRRTQHFGGSNATQLKNWANSYYGPSEENGVMALRMADEHFAFRSNANRVYILFTDEPNQTDGYSAYSVNYVKNNWTASKGTIHVIYSDGRRCNTSGNNEDPCLLADYTGGEILITTSSFNVNLNDLPVTGAMTNSYVIRLYNIGKYRDGNQHTVRIRVVSTDNLTIADKSFPVVFPAN